MMIGPNPFLAIDLLCQQIEKATNRVREWTRMNAELAMWQAETRRYVRWYNGKITLHGVPPPGSSEKVITTTDARKNACMTWNNIHQKRKYLADLDLRDDAFSGLRLLDLCSGPLPNALCFRDCEIYGIDHLMNRYSEIGFPTIEYDSRYHFVQGKVESMPFEDGFFDAAIAVNALDHIDNLYLASRNLKRVLKRNGLVRFIVEYHKSTVTEPLELNDDIILERFSWVRGLKKISESSADWKWPEKDLAVAANRSRYHRDSGLSPRKYALWSNF